MLVENKFKGKVVKYMEYEENTHIRIEFEDGSEFWISSKNQDELQILRTV